MMLLYYFVGLLVGVLTLVVVLNSDMPSSVAILVAGMTTISGLLIVGILEMTAERLAKWIEG